MARNFMNSNALRNLNEMLKEEYKERGLSPIEFDPAPSSPPPDPTYSLYDRMLENTINERRAREELASQIRKRAKNINHIRKRRSHNPTRTATAVGIFIAGTIVFAALIAAPFGDFDYAYYQSLRWIVTAFFTWKLLSLWKSLGIFFRIAFALVIIIFNPIAPINFDRETWAANDIVAACLIPFSGFWNKSTKWYARTLLVIFVLVAALFVATYAGGVTRDGSSGSGRTYRRTPVRRSRPYQRPSRRNEFYINPSLSGSIGAFIL